MKAAEFCYWFQGYMEIAGEQALEQGLGKEQLDVVRRHLSLVFKHELDPTHGDAKHQAELQAMHDGFPFNGHRPDPDGLIMRC